MQEKSGQLSQYFYVSVELPEGTDLDLLPPAAREVIGRSKIVEDAVAAGGAGSLLFVKEPALANRLQRLAVQDSPHGIPMLFGFDVIHGMRTVFPVPIALAASWSPDLIEQVQATAARESRAVGVHWTFAPMIDVTRDARWGRIVEGAGEDPTLASAVAAAQVRGFQGDFGVDNILAGPKHLAGYGASRGGRDYDDVELSDSELWNVYLPPFRAAVDAGAATVMSAYMDLNGVPASANRWLMTDVLRDSLGFDGFVVSDANAVRSLHTQHHAADLQDAAARAINAGLDMEMMMVDPAFSRLPDAVAQGLVSEDTLDAAVRRVLTAKFQMGLFENPYVDETATYAVLNAPEHREIAAAAAAQSIVLLKNENAALPLSRAGLNTVAVIGELADSKRDTLGPWVFDHDVDETVTILAGLRAAIGPDVRVDHAAGVHIPGRAFPSMFDMAEGITAPHRSADEDDTALDEAVALAAAADVAVVVVGQRQNQIGEMASTATLDLPGRQLEQLQRIAATGTPVVLVLMSGRPLDLRWADQHIPAIVQAWYPGTRGGDAVAAVLLGDVTPAGRLPFTWPRHVGHVPMVYSHNRTFQPENQGTRYFEEHSTPLYPFGHGLSYSHFTYDGVTVDRDTIAVGESTRISVDVTNAGDREADEVVQLYTHQRYGTSSRPIRELKGFRRITLPAGGTETVTFELGPDQLRYWSAATRDDVQDTTTIDIWVGGDSTAQLAAALDVIDPTRA